MKLNQQPNKFCYSLLLKGLCCVANSDRLYTLIVCIVEQKEVNNLLDCIHML